MSLPSLGDGYKDIVKSVADYMILRQLVEHLSDEPFFPLSKDRGLNSSFYKDSAFLSLKRFTDVYFKWYHELATNNRAFAPLHYDNPRMMSGFIKHMNLDAKDDKAANGRNEVGNEKRPQHIRFVEDALQHKAGGTNTHHKSF